MIAKDRTAVTPTATLGLFHVASASRGGYYPVRVDAASGTVRCGCKAGAWGNRCWHVDAVVDFMLDATGADEITGLRLPAPSVRSTGAKGRRGATRVLVA